MLPSREPVTQTKAVNYSRAVILFGVILSLCVSALFPYIYYIAVRRIIGPNEIYNPLNQYLQLLKLNPAVSLGTSFIISLVVAFSFFRYALRSRAKA